MDPKQLLNQLLGHQGASAAAGGFLGGSLAGLLSSKGGRRGLRKTATYGGIAALGVMAFQAFQRSQQQRGGVVPGAGAPSPAVAMPPPSPATAMPPPAHPVAAPPPPPVTPEAAEAAAQAATDARFLPSADDEQELDSLASRVLAAMVSAAKADGVLDADEQRRIQAQLEEADLGPEHKARVLELMDEPADPHRVAAMARTPEEGAELYLASALAIEPDHWAEQAYLRTLREALGLDPALARELEAAAAQRA